MSQPNPFASQLTEQTAPENPSGSAFVFHPPKLFALFQR